MDYHRIHKPQSGILSPSKLRAKLMGLSPTKRNESSETHSSMPLDFDVHHTASTCILHQNHNIVHSSSVHPFKSGEDENLDYDSNASSSSFEFHKGERVAHTTLTRSLSRPTSYKWNDADKWIMNKQLSQGHTAPNRVLGISTVRVAPDIAATYQCRQHPQTPDLKPVDVCPSLESFTLPHPVINQVGSIDNSALDAPSTPAIRAISMRDMGTEMTPATSLEPSRTATPAGATTPLRSPTSSIPSTPRTGEPATTSMGHTADCDTRYLSEKGNKDLTEQELKLKTRSEIVALGVQLGKMNIAAWASKVEKDKSSSPRGTVDSDELERMEFEKRAAAWEEAEKSKHGARYKREEIEIQAWESHQKAKLEEELSRIEAKVERLRRQSQAKMMKKITMARKKSEAKRAAAETEKRHRAEKTAAQAEFIRQTGRIPREHYVCCGLFS